MNVSTGNPGFSALTQERQQFIEAPALVSSAGLVWIYDYQTISAQVHFPDIGEGTETLQSASKRPQEGEAVFVGPVLPVVEVLVHHPPVGQGDTFLSYSQAVEVPRPELGFHE